MNDAEAEAVREILTDTYRAMLSDGLTNLDLLGTLQHWHDVESYCRPLHPHAFYLLRVVAMHAISQGILVADLKHSLADLEDWGKETQLACKVFAESLPIVVAAKVPGFPPGTYH